MREHIHKVLKQHWGYDNFRPLQEDIILSAMSGKDTLALLPTGGGKSICFQVPVMAAEGIGLVVSPLIALMDDQVQNLKKLNIPAIALTSGYSYREIDLALENCVQGKYKFLYLSPERLKSELVQERLKRMKVNLLAVDEAHCISQWGYDFRPPYLEIAEIRKLLANVPVLALTATATPRVVEDIQQKLNFRQTNVFQKSFYRSNLHYNVLKTEKKWSKTLEILQKIPGTAIIYARNRRHTVEIAEWLKKNGFTADHYHAGLSTAERKSKQQEWIQNKTRIMVCTNAFGMGIDKPDVRLVLHLDLPDSLEAYFQEAGRGGRDGNTSYSVILVGPSDIEDLRSKYLQSFPELDFIKHVHQCLFNHLQLATGSGEGISYDFDFNVFVKKYSLPSLKTYQAFKIMEKEGLIQLNEGFERSSKILITTDKTTLYDFQLRHPKLDGFIKTLLRSYGGLDTEYTSINENLLAARLKIPYEEVKKILLHLKKQGVIDYQPREEKSFITVNENRQQAKHLSVSPENHRYRFEDLKKRIGAVTDFVESDHICRSKLLLNYFGEKSTTECGHCDVCRKKDNQSDKGSLTKRIVQFLKEQREASVTEISKEFRIKEASLAESLRELVDEGTVTVTTDKVTLNK